MSQLNGVCSLCGSAAYVGFATRIECTNARCTNNRRYARLGECARQRLRELWTELDELDDAAGADAYARKVKIREEIDRILGS